MTRADSSWLFRAPADFVLDEIAAGRARVAIEGRRVAALLSANCAWAGSGGMAMLAGMTGRRRGGSAGSGRGTALGIALALLVHVAFVLPLSAAPLESLSGPTVECDCPDAEPAAFDGVGSLLADDAGEGADCEQCACCGAPGSSSWIAPDSPRIVLRSDGRPATEAIEPSAVDPPRIPRPPERSLR